MNRRLGVDHIKNVLWREALITESPEATEKRLQIIAENPNPLRRTGSYVLHMITKHIRGIALDILTTPYERKGLSYVGGGWNSSVFRYGDNVIKILRDTELQPPDKRQARIEHVESLIEVNQHCHPDIAVTAAVSEILHPISDRPTAAIIQPFVHGTDALKTERTPEISNRLQEFAERSLDEMVPHGFAPDVIGPGNLLIHGEGEEPRLSLVDTVALRDTPSSHATFPLSVKRLQELANPKANILKR